MKLKHTQSKKANRSFDTKWTGFENEQVRKQAYKNANSFGARKKRIEANIQAKKMNR